MQSQELKKLRDWFIKNAAELPWRPLDVDAPRDPYAVWISETMLQQTQVATVRDYFIRWMKRFPDIITLANAQEDEVFKYWQGLGYYSRARNILRTAKTVVETATRTMPTTRKELEALPGIGAYTAGAILSLANHQREAILDGNLVRIFSRMEMMDFLPTSQDCAEIYWNIARQVADHPKGYLHNEALMELGRTICKVKNPSCQQCPLKNGCQAFAAGKISEYPPSKKRFQKDWHGTVLIIESNDHKILTVHGGQKFFSNQFTLPHFESPRSATIGIPQDASKYISADFIENVKELGSFKHSITIHKMECLVLYIKIAASAQQAQETTRQQTGNTDNMEFRWIKKTSATEALANSFSLKALKLIQD